MADKATVTAPPGEARVPLHRLIGWGVSGQVVFVASQFVLLLSLTRFATVEDVGHFGLASAIATPIYFMLTFGFRANQATDLESRHSFREFMALRLICTAVSYTIILVIGFLFLDPAPRWVLFAFAAARGAETTSTTTYGLFQKFDRMDRVAYSQITRGLGGAAIFAIVMAWTRSPMDAYIALFLAWFAIAALMDVRFARKLAAGSEDDRPATLSGIVAIVRTSWPLAVNGFLAGTQISIPRIFVNGILGQAALGQFTVVAYAIQAIITLTTAIAQSIISRMAHYLRDGNLRAYYRVLHGGMAVLFIASAVGALMAVFLGDPLLRIVFGSEYGDLGLVLGLCLVTASLASPASLLEAGLFAARSFMTSMLTRITVVVVTTVASLAGALAAGLHGVVIGMALTALLQCLILYIQIRKWSQRAASEAQARLDYIK